MKQTKKRAAPRLQFSKEERAAPNLQRHIVQAEKAADKRDTAQKKLLTKKWTSTITEDSAVQRHAVLRFEEKTPKPPEKLRHAVSNSITSELHRQIGQNNEDENTGVEAVLQGERAGEAVLRQGEDAYHTYRMHPYRTLQKAEARLDRANVRALEAKQRYEHPQFSSNPVSRRQQKRAIRKQYAAIKAGMHTAGTQQTARGAAQAVDNGTTTVRKAVTALRPKHSAFLFVMLGAMLMFVMNSISACMPVAENIMNAFVISTYPAEEEDVLAAERVYAQMERDLQDELDHYEAFHPGFDEYIINAQDIWHDPYALIAIISAYHGGEEWTIDSAMPTLKRYFDLQYILTQEVTTQTRWRTETRTGQRLVTDPVTGESHWENYTYEEDVAYSYTICNVKLENKDLSHLPIYTMSREKVGLYALYMSTLGNMPDLFAGNAYASELKDPMLYDIPEDVLAADARFAAMIEEANKYIGFPYVWGGDSPETSFDCSGFVSYVFTQSGYCNTGRLGATGLHGICREISSDEVRPGDLVFFEGTMGADVGGITHVGIFVGDNKMIHCGSPIGYADLTRAYWQQHFYGYGRVPE